MYTVQMPDMHAVYKFCNMRHIHYVASCHEQVVCLVCIRGCPTIMSSSCGFTAVKPISKLGLCPDSDCVRCGRCKVSDCVGTLR